MWGTAGPDVIKLKTLIIFSRWYCDFSRVCGSIYKDVCKSNKQKYTSLFNHITRCDSSTTNMVSNETNKGTSLLKSEMYGVEGSPVSSEL